MYTLADAGYDHVVAVVDEGGGVIDTRELVLAWGRAGLRPGWFAQRLSARCSCL